MLFMIAGESKGSGKSRERGRATNKFISQANQLLFYFKMNEHMNSLLWRFFKVFFIKIY